MATDQDIHALILTLDEQRHIARAIESLKGQCASVMVIDSGSKDRTVEIARDHGAEVVVNPFVNHAAQINFGISLLAGRRGWLLRMDADEIVDPDGRESLLQAIARTPMDVTGLLVARRIHFLGQRIRHGAIEPSWQLRLWRNGSGRCEQRWMDEHVQVVGGVARCGVILSDINLNSITWWTMKHNNYASREAIEILNLRYRILATEGIGLTLASPQARRRRFIKERIYAKLPSGGRALTYFVYRYFFRFGFLDGRAGFYFHMMQALWYRTLVDLKVAEVENFAKKNGVDMYAAIRDRTGIDIKKPFPDSPVAEEKK